MASELIPRTASERWDWLHHQRPGLQALCSACPDDWQAVHAELDGLFTRNNAAELHLAYQQSCVERADDERLLSGERDGRAFAELVSRTVRQRMRRLALQQFVLAQASGVSHGKVRLNAFNGLLAQWLFFQNKLERKATPMWRYRVFWPWLSQKRLLLPLLESRGIYCFYSRELLDALARLLRGKRVLEVGAGDGTLSRLLRERGVDIQASDDHSWASVIDYPDWVARHDAIDAVQRFRPQIVLCAWPPAGNGFEKHLFRQPGLEAYLMLGPRNSALCGDHTAYRQQSAFDWGEVPGLGQLILPHTLDASVWLFRRKASQT